jgi:hypothetical protein
LRADFFIVCPASQFRQLKLPYKTHFALPQKLVFFPSETHFFKRSSELSGSDLELFPSAPALYTRLIAAQVFSI